MGCMTACYEWADSYDSKVCRILFIQFPSWEMKAKMLGICCDRSLLQDTNKIYSLREYQNKEQSPLHMNVRHSPRKTNNTLLSNI